MRNAVLNWLFPRTVRCVACREPRKITSGCLCGRCAAELEKERMPSAACPKCLSLMDRDGTCRFCRDGGMEGLQKAYAPFGYVRVARRLVTQLKFEYTDDVLPQLTDAMADALDGDRFDCLMPVPLFPRRQRVRGCNQAELLAGGVAARTGMPLLDALCRVRETRAQSTLKKHGDRLNNVKDAFAIRSDADVRGKCILLVDDVRTSGSTARECVQVLLNAGAKEVSLLTACAVWKYREMKHGKMAGKNGAAAGSDGR